MRSLRREATTTTPILGVRATIARMKGHRTDQPPASYTEKRARRRQRVDHARRQLQAQAERRRNQLSKPPLTAALASQFARLLASGAPADVALSYLAPGYYQRCSAHARADWLREVAGSTLVVDAQTALNGADWPSLSAERRLQIALDKHLAERAFFLYTHSYEDAEANELRKLEASAAILLDYLSDDDADDDTPYKRFVRDFMARYEAEGGVEVGVPLASVPSDVPPS